MTLGQRFISLLRLSGIASATMYDGAKDMAYCDTQLRVAFDGDAALFSDECEHTVKEHGMDKLYQHETMFENKASAQVGSLISNELILQQVNIDFFFHWDYFYFRQAIPNSLILYNFFHIFSEFFLFETSPADFLILCFISFWKILL